MFTVDLVAWFPALGYQSPVSCGEVVVHQRPQMHEDENPCSGVVFLSDGGYSGAVISERNRLGAATAGPAHA